ncbi:peptide chain release factor N(5)-glutamine methyltransferase [Campylobacter peloridis]|uniref:peptide chain release factor N(5)-glutamine methyltransferase n=1 Tax=Campylobacter peloridis TaxID=488546 RepID=A0A5C7DXZ0_9BACT|nr:peptide chain release factor N(5)-glutamine methyltransferase [Campylobacter peloridis]
MISIKEALKQAYAKDPTHKEHMLFILCELLQKDKAWIFLNSDFQINEKIFFDYVDKFLNGEPFEYLFKKTQFYGFDFFIEKGVLIPRFDSEILLEKCLEILNTNSFKNILEIGFGSGILSISLAKLKQIHIQACDINPKALKLAKKNAQLHNVLNLVDFKLCDFKNIQGNFDFIFSNPPYIKNDYPLDKWVKNEPHSALFGGDKGWEILHEIILFAKAKNTKILACEFGYDQKDILQDILEKNNFRAFFYKDYNNFDRAFVAYNLKY